MKLTRLLALGAALLCAPLSAFAISISGVGASAAGTNPSAPMSGSVAAGTVIEVLIQESNSPGCPTPVLSDSVNTGNYSTLEEYQDPNNNIVGIYWIIATSTGTPTISASLGGCYGRFWANQIVGFSGTPTADASLANHASGTSSATVAINATNNFANEVMLVSWAAHTNAGTSGGAGWSTPYGCGNPYGCTGASGFGGALAVETSPATVNNYSATLSAADDWGIVLGGIYDSPSAPTGSGNALLFNQVPVSQWQSVSSSETLPVAPGGTVRILCNASGGAVTLTLPTAVSNYTQYQMLKSDTSGNACTLAGALSQTINGSASQSTTTQWNGYWAASTNSNWAGQALH